MTVFKGLILFLLASSCSVLTMNTAASNDKYDACLYQAINTLIQGKTLTVDQIVKAIPSTEDEFFLFYSYTEKEEKENIAFYELNNLIFEHAMNKERTVFKSFLLLSEFVDGEYAESYFEDVEALAEKNKIIFCELYSQLPKKK